MCRSLKWNVDDTCELHEEIHEGEKKKNKNQECESNKNYRIPPV